MLDSDRELELAPVDLLEEIAPTPRAPELELRIIVGAEPQQHEVGADLGTQSVDDATAATVESVGDAKDRRELAQPLAIVVVERSEARF